MDISFFGVPKGDDDIRMVYDGMKSRINSATWAPSFFLPTSITLTRILDPYSYQMDMDVGEMFLNFPLDVNLRKFCGVNLANVGLDKLDGRYRWSVLWMGFRPSAFLATRYMAIAVEQSVGGPSEKGNPLGWDQIMLNLPGADEFNPTLT